VDLVTLRISNPKEGVINMVAAKGEQRAVLVLPDVGLSEEQIDSVKADFQNNLVGSLERAGGRMANRIIVVVVVVVAAQA
jgi:hypothetical protein